jgi:hypothetical protein
MREKIKQENKQENRLEEPGGLVDRVCLLPFALFSV